ncbi:Adenosine deaminase CECR1, partial [Armadillidium vulgare]
EFHDINDIWRSFEEAFGAISGLVLYWRAWEAYLYRAFEECIEDNISYIEFRGVLSSSTYMISSLLKNIRDKDSQELQYMFVDEDKAWHYVNLVVKLKERFPKTIAGFDLVGQEDLGHPLMTFIDPILYLKNRDPPIPFFFHAGETNWKGMLTDGNLYDALLLNTSRIGHGYAIVNHPELMNIARERDIAIEVCPISNQVLKLVEDLRNHPASALAADSFPLVVSSDDPPMWESTLLSHDFYEFFMGIGGASADLRFLKKLALNSIR